MPVIFRQSNAGRLAVVAREPGTKAPAGPKPCRAEGAAASPWHEERPAAARRPRTDRRGISKGAGALGGRRVGRARLGTAHPNYLQVGRSSQSFLVRKLANAF